MASKKNGDSGASEPELNEDGTPKVELNEDGTPKVELNKDGSPKEYQKSEAQPLPDKTRKQKVAELRDNDSALATKVASAQEKRAQAEAEYQDLVRQAAENNARLTQAIGTPSVRPTTVSEYSKQQAEKDADMVDVWIPKPFLHRLDDHTLLEVSPGRRSVPKALADHWWFTANGVAKMAA